MPNFAEKKVLVSGMVTCPPSPCHLPYLVQSYPMPLSGYVIKELKKEHTYSDLSIEMSQSITC
jgi:hypothetical protein